MERILKEITHKFGATGEEGELRKYLKKIFSSLFKVEEDSLGNLHVKKNNKSRFLFLTGMDENTFFVSGKEKEFYKFKMLGNYKPVNLIDKMVVFKNGKKGVIRNVSDKDNPGIDDLLLEVLGKEEVQIGEAFIIEPYFYTYGDFFLSTNLDVRAGVAFLINFFKRKKFKDSFKILFLSQTKMRNKTFYIPGKEETEFCFVINSFPCKSGIEVGKGPVLSLFSKDYVLPVKERNEILKIFKTLKLSFQIGLGEEPYFFPLYLESGGLKKVIILSIPVKYHDSVYKIAHKRDFSLLEDLLENLLKTL